MGYTLLKDNNNGLAYNVLHRSLALKPDEPAAWHNIGKILHECQKDNDADEAFRRAVKLRANFAPSLEGLSMSAMNRGDFEGCIAYANRALAEDHSAVDARVNRGMAYLALKRWSEGWRDFSANLGIDKNRKEMVYGSEPRWDGTKGLNIVCYGEQGIGDELAFSSCIPDLIRDSHHVTFETDMRLRGLFRRSFPQATVEGTRYKLERPEWVSQKKFHARVALGELPKFYRKKDEDFPGTPYLKPNPEMALQWRAILNTLPKKPNIGLAWSGGIARTGYRKRSLTLDALSPLFSFDANWISLQYKDEDLGNAEEKYGIKIHDWAWGVRAPGAYDYDITAALVSELDLVITVSTAVVDLCGGLGKECWCLIPEAAMWRYPASGEWYPWAKSVQLFRQKKGQWPVYILLGKLKDHEGLHRA